MFDRFSQKELIFPCITIIICSICSSSITIIICSSIVIYSIQMGGGPIRTTTILTPQLWYRRIIQFLYGYIRWDT